MMASVKAGRILELPSLPTFSDGTAGGVEAGSVTFALCQQLIDDYLTVSENEIKLALRSFLEGHHMLIEGAAAVVLAAYERLRQDLRGRVVLLICGANISLNDLRQILSEDYRY
jgi:threonine dehydratase